MNPPFSWPWSRLAACCVLLSLAASASADVLAEVHADLARLPVDVRPHTRYLTLHNLPEAERVQALQVLSGHANSLSRESDLVPVQAVPGTAGALLRVNLCDYGWPRDVWEKLADADPWYHVRVEVTEPWPGGVWPDDGIYYAPGSFPVIKRKTALAPWLSEGEGRKQLLADVVAWTQSQAPFARADWWFWQSAVQEGRAAGYYDWLGIRDETTFQKLVRFDAKLAARLEHRRVVAFSGITQQPRRAERTATVLGGLWRTFDNVLATDKRNPLRVLDDNFEHDATEQFAPLPNGLPAWFLGNARGERQDKAPDNVVRGDFTGAGETRLHVNLSCVRCHALTKEENFVKDVGEQKVRTLSAGDYEKYRELRRQYLRDVAPALRQDRALYAAAVQEATGGLTVQQYAQLYGRFYARYDQARVDLARAALDLETTPERLQKALDAYGPGLDPVLGIIKDGGVVGVRQWEEIYGTAQAILRGGRQ